MKLLIADDDPQMVRALRITLAAHGYDVVDPRLVYGLARTRLPALLAALRAAG